MPKILESVRERAIAEARTILTGEGYAAMTMRRIAKALGIAPATIYNYFPSKENLAACVMLEDWQAMTGALEAQTGGRGAEETVRTLFSMVQAFTQTYLRSWSQYEEDERSDAIRRRYHGVLTEQLSRYILRALPPEKAAAEPWLAPFLAELLLRFGADGGSGYGDIGPAVKRLLQ